MHDEPDDRDLIIMDDEGAGGISRWLPTTVVLTAIAGFVALAWYAYHAGTQSVNDEDLLVVEADKTPMKEKPVDPGGMKFPDQDKTIFDTFAGKQDQPAKVERVLPPPEEPVKKEGPTGWINENLRKGESAKTEAAQAEQVIGKEEKDVAPPAEEPAPVAEVKKDESKKPDVKIAPSSETQTFVAKDAKDTVKPAAPVAEVKKEEPKPEAKPAPKVEAKAEPKPAPVAAVKPAPAAEKAAAKPAAGGVKVQLGAYRSEKEAMAAWTKIGKDNAPLLSGRDPVIVKADLGERGVYYRLRVAGFASALDAKSFCSKLSAKGQACILASN